MNITEVPFNKLIGVSHSKNSKYLLQLDAKPQYTNHLGTVHAAALFALAEGSGAQLLLNLFPKNLISNTVPVLRKTNVSYKKPATGIISSLATIKNNTIEAVICELQAKNRVLIITTVNLFNEKDEKVFNADFEWFVVLKN